MNGSFAFSGINYVWRPGADTLIGPAGTHCWELSAFSKGLLDHVLSFNKIESLVGGTGADTFLMQPTGQLAGSINGGGGANTLGYWLMECGGIQPEYGCSQRHGHRRGQHPGPHRLAVGTILTGPNSSNAWTITGLNAGMLNGSFSSFANVESLYGGTANDMFAMLSGGQTSGVFDGKGGSNSLDYSSYPAPATVNLQSSSGTGVAGFKKRSDVDRYQCFGRYPCGR